MNDSARPTARLELKGPHPMASWALNVATTVGLGICSFFFHDLTNKIETLTEAMAGLKSQVAVLESNVSRAAGVEGRVTLIEASLARASAERDALKDRIQALEARPR